jgi:hypothetical protein
VKLAYRGVDRAHRAGGGAAGVIPQMTFLVNTPIVLDPSGPLYAAIGAGNLRAYVQGQDDRGAAALSN